MKRLIVFAALLCLAALTAGCGGSAHGNTLAYIANANGTGFTVYTVKTDGTLSLAGISPQTTPAPLTMQITPNGKWAFFLNALGPDYNVGDSIYGYTRSGSGNFDHPIDNSPYLLNGTATSLALSANSQFLYVAKVSAGVPLLAIYSINQTTGTLTPAGSPLNIGYTIQQLIISPDGTVLYGLSPTQEAVVTWTLDAASGAATQADTASVGVDPEYMILSANGSWLYVLDAAATLPNTPNIAGGAAGNSPIFYGFTTNSNNTKGKLGLMPGASNGSATNIFTENASLLDPAHAFPQHPIAGTTSNDSRFLFIVNRNSANISAFRLDPTTGEPTEILGSLIVVNGVQGTTQSPFPCGDGCTAPTFTAIATLNNGIYVLEQSTGRIYQDAVDTNTGVLRNMTTPWVSAESNTSQPTWITIR
jgi:hypothetical protein